MLKKFKAIWSAPFQKPEEIQKFLNILEIANKIAAVDPQGLRQLVCALLRPLQAEHMIGVAENAPHKAPKDLFYLDFFFPLNKVAQSSEFYLRDKPQFEIELARDIVLPTPWKKDRYVNALATIGTGKCMGAWKPDYRNHAITVVLPWRIGFVTGGNHSITEGILMGEGKIFANEVFDMSPLLQRVHCDGRTYRETETNRILGEVTDHRRAAVFEIGRSIVNSLRSP
jgi:hypothetical protein